MAPECAFTALSSQAKRANIPRDFRVELAQHRRMVIDSSWFKGRLRDCGLTQDAVAEAIGRDRTVVSRILNGRQKLKLSEAEPLSRLLDVPVAEILRRAGLDIPEPDAPALEHPTESTLRTLIDKSVEEAMASVKPSQVPWLQDVLRIIEHTFEVARDEGDLHSIDGAKFARRVALGIDVYERSMGNVRSSVKE